MDHIIGIIAMIFGFIGMAIKNYAGAFCCFGFAFILWTLNFECCCDNCDYYMDCFKD